MSGIRSYIEDNDVKITVLNNKINIVNYVDIGHFDSDKILIKTKDKNIIIKGENLTVTKLMNDEILILGNFNNIEFR